MNWKNRLYKVAEDADDDEDGGDEGDDSTEEGLNYDRYALAAKLTNRKHAELRKMASGIASKKNLAPLTSFPSAPRPSV
ncbi:hypothetical protein KM043_011648 [Ampulex compressa]|nr:hypothetical protein KM043_011648 [Ampulex compressa]